MAVPGQRISYKSPRRDKFEIWSALLEACVYQARTQSWLMRKLGLNTAAIKEHLEALVKAGLLFLTDKPDFGRYEYRITEKGRTGLKQYYLLISQFFIS